MTPLDPLQEAARARAVAERYYHEFVDLREVRIDHDALYQQGIYGLKWHVPKLPGLGDVAWGPFFGALTDALLDPNQHFDVRRRLARVFSVCVSQRAAGGLLLALDDARFDVRFQAARSLNAIVEKNPRVLVLSTHGFFLPEDGKVATGNPLLRCGLMLAAYKRWDSLSAEEKQRYIDQAKQYSRQASSYARQAAARTARNKRKRGR